MKDYCPEETYGLICELIQNREKKEYRLDDIEVRKWDPNYQLVTDYAYRFHNWQ